MNATQQKALLFELRIVRAQLETVANNVLETDGYTAAVTELVTAARCVDAALTFIKEG